MKHVLVIDDCEEFCKSTAMILEDAGYEVTVATDPSSILPLCQEEEFQVILCDLVLPFPNGDADEPDSMSAMVGIDLMRRVNEQFPELRIILVSGHLMDGPLQSLRYFGASATLAKPFGRKELINCIEAVVARN